MKFSTISCKLMENIIAVWLFITGVEGRIKRHFLSYERNSDGFMIMSAPHHTKLLLHAWFLHWYSLTQTDDDRL